MLLFTVYHSSLDYVNLLALTGYLTQERNDVEQMYRRMVFNYLTENKDDHCKNFSFFVDKDDNGWNWHLAPAYDLLNVQLHLPEDKEETALTIGGKKSRLTKSDFVILGTKLGLSEKQIENVFKRFLKAEKKMLLLIEQSFLSDANKINYKDLFIERISLVSGLN